MSVIEKDARYPMNAAELRDTFDRGFAIAEGSGTTDIDDFLGIRVGARPFALRLTDLARIEACGKVVALPDGNAWLLGLTNSQGKLVPVFSLELALGFARTSGWKTWLAIFGLENPLGVVFDSLERYLRIPRTDIFATGGAESNRKHDRQAIRGDGELRPIVSLPSILAAIRDRVAAHTIAEGT